ncbi:MAG TPA: hypothetical protein DCK76_05700 [Desulfotomaculum sp.]|nr:hypothetical protein [Desulfotomaculum sp.]HBY03057.1 hypothetical protein [Desulfotomaculum sp.]
MGEPVKKYLIILFLLAPAMVCLPGTGLGAEKPVKDLNLAAQPVTSFEMIKRTVVLDPGHGGIDPGAVGSSGVLEKDVALSISKRLASLFRQSGAKVVLTRDKDKEPGNGAGNVPDKVEDLAHRVKISEQSRADVLLSIHLNSFSGSGEYGAQVFYQSGSVEGKKLAKSIQSQLNICLVDSGREALPGDFFVCRNSRAPAVIVEVGFLSNLEEEKELTEPFYQTRASWAIFRGVANYFSEEGV